MQNLKSRLGNLEQNGQRNQYVVVVVKDGETQEQALARVKPHPDQLVIIVDRSCQHIK